MFVYLNSVEMNLSGPNFTHWPISSGNSPGVQDSTARVRLNNFLPNIYRAPQRIKPNELQLSRTYDKQSDIKETDVRHGFRNEPCADQFIPRPSGSPRTVRNRGQSSSPSDRKRWKRSGVPKTQRTLCNTAVTNDGIMSLRELLTSALN